MIKLGSLTVLTAALMLLCGCRTDSYYQHRAAERAREYLLDHAPELTAEQTGYVKYTFPEVLRAPVLSGYNTGVDQIIMMWRIPDADQLYLVLGTSSARMDNWYPLRLLRKNYVAADSSLIGAISNCRNYALTNFHGDLSAAELNVIRLNDPVIVDSSFPVDELRDDPGENPGHQLSVIWKLPETGRAAVFCGYSRGGTMAGWQVNLASLMPEAQLTGKIGAVRKQPGDFNTPLTPVTAKE